MHYAGFTLGDFSGVEYDNDGDAIGRPPGVRRYAYCASCGLQVAYIARREKHTCLACSAKPGVKKPPMRDSEGHSPIQADAMAVIRQRPGHWWSSSEVETAIRGLESRATSGGIGAALCWLTKRGRLVKRKSPEKKAGHYYLLYKLKGGGE